MRRRCTSEHATDRRRSGEEGFTLVESLVAMVVLGIGVVGIMGALATLLNTTSRHRQMANVANVLDSATAAVVDQSRNAFLDCAVTATYAPTNGVTLPTGWVAGNVTITAIRYWNGADYVAVCPTGAFKPPTWALMQQVDVTATSPDGRATRKITVVKRAV